MTWVDPASATASGIPDAVVRSWERQLGGQRAEAARLGSLRIRPRAFRANPWRLDPAALPAALADAGIAAAAHPGLPWAYTCDRAGEYALKGHALWRGGSVYSQSLASQCPPWILAPEPGMRVLDATAAPGGKTALLSALVGGSGQVVALERARIRYERLLHNLGHLGCPNTIAHCSDARAPGDLGRFDAILCDPPCSGSGTITGDPRTSAHLVDDYDGYVASRAAIQAAILAGCAPLLRPGGRLCYSTCSIDPREDEQVVAAFLARGGFRPVDIAAWIPRLPGAEPAGTGLRIMPGATEGFFVALLERC